MHPARLFLLFLRHNHQHPNILFDNIPSRASTPLSLPIELSKQTVSH